jgi:hypothetical protein
MQNEQQPLRFEARVMGLMDWPCGGRKWVIGGQPAYLVIIHADDIDKFKSVHNSQRIPYHGNVIGVYATDDPCTGIFELYYTPRGQCMLARWIGPSSSASEPLPEQQPAPFRFEARVLGTHQWIQKGLADPEPSLEFGTVYPVAVLRADIGPFAKLGRTPYREWVDPVYGVYAHSKPVSGPGLFEVFDERRIHWVGPIVKPADKPIEPLETTAPLPETTKDYSTEFQNMLGARSRGLAVVIQAIRPDLTGYTAHKQQMTAQTGDATFPCAQCDALRTRKGDAPYDILAHLAGNAAICLKAETNPTYVYATCERTDEPSRGTYCISHYTSTLWIKPQI